LFVVITVIAASASARAGSLQGPGTYDFDGDSVTDVSLSNAGNIVVLDNAVNIFNPSQADMDADGIGDAADPFPSQSNPGPYPISFTFTTPTVTIPVGGTATLGVHSNQLPNGNAGMFLSDRDGNGWYDSAVDIAFDTFGNGSFTVTPAYPLTAFIDLNTPGTYLLPLELYGSTFAFSPPQTATIIVAPEPTAVAALALGSLALRRRR
jgi:hypothetical protein